MSRILTAIISPVALVSVMAAAAATIGVASTVQAKAAPAAASAASAATGRSAPARVARPATAYQPGTARFSQNVALRCPVATSDGEPSVRVDARGNCYVAGIRGVPAGVDLWRFDVNPASPTFDPGLQSPTYLGQPDVFVPTDPNDPTAGGADGGGDVDLAVSFPVSPDSTPKLTLVSLALANIFSAYSADRGQTFIKSPATVPIPADDRMWIEADGESTIYMEYRAPIPATALFVATSHDHGATFPVTGLVSTSGTTPGYIDVDHVNHIIYAANVSSSAGKVAHSSDGITWTNVTVDATTAHGALFDVVKVGQDGTVYFVWSNQQDIFLSYSTDHGVTWSPKLRVNDNSTYKTNLMPWIAAGSAGRVDVVWFGTPSATNSDAAEWQVLFAQSLNANTPNPTFRQQAISDHVIHGAPISLGGLTGSSNRNLLDYFQVALDPQGAAVVAFADDHNDYNGHTYVTRQLDGPSLYANANGGTGVVNPAFPPPLPQPDPALPQVVDFLHDATAGLVQPIPEDNPFDVVSVRYSCELGPQGPVMVTTMKVSSLNPLPPGGIWRTSFSANAPGGVSDHGDQFYFRADLDSLKNATFTWGTAVRADSGLLHYTVRGSADFGALDTMGGNIIVKVALSRLNALLPAGHALIADGSVLFGLRGQTIEPTTGGSRDPLRDQTRGGTSYTVGCIGATAVGVAELAAQQVGAGAVELHWSVDAPVGATVTVDRAESREGPYAAISAPLAVRAGSDAMSFRDDTARPGAVYFYRVGLTTGGSTSFAGPYRVALRAAQLALGPSRPNPFRETAALDFEIATAGRATLDLYSVTGQRVRRLLDQVRQPGPGSVTLRADDLGAGVYFARLSSGGRTVTTRVMVLR